ncbi:alcohol dehydrogenase catalytic domain-containing protein [Modestobacter sp. I12A-02628]|uniref:alcohol dehydrogenase (NADP(+)) n=1 Tax=Goekera deserti TaxID=2497753 RepID=A0A7K3WJ99_9ACTN|nr:alcohol dehydrogenase catalytic domain-containing protein [Goekera deserti]NDI50479.1 alcohol dehydrogenase catalytic domain-containing protein [Goekera deserti]NEL56575.1 NAD(P)-dependent alcohol dehydrogenase [Goekera deserti]
MRGEQCGRDRGSQEGTACASCGPRRPRTRSEEPSTVPTTVNARSTAGPRVPFQRTTIERRDLRPEDVRIDIAYAGICHSDIHTARGEWGATNYPLVPGHEIAGTVAEVGSAVTKYAVGDRVGVGCFVDSCRECENCLAGEEQYCLQGETGTYGGVQDGKPTDGGYSQQIVVAQDYVLGIPEGIGLDVAAPLLCAGITLYSPLKHWGAGPGTKVAVVGLGGLGHMGVKIAHALGAEVTVLSQSLKKQEDGLRLGADHFFATSDPETFQQLRGRFDLIVNTVSATLDLDAYLGMLRVNGTLVEVGAPEQPMTEAAFSLIQNRRSLAGSKIGGIRETQEMLDFCAEHGLGAEIEVISADQIDEAYERIVASDVRYRFVIDASTV